MVIYSAVKKMRENGKSILPVHFNYINPLPKNTKAVSKLKN